MARDERNTAEKTLVMFTRRLLRSFLTLIVQTFSPKQKSL